MESRRQKKAIIILIVVIVLAIVGNLAYQEYKEKNKIISFSEAVEIAKDDAGIDIMKKNIVSLGNDVYEECTFFYTDYITHFILHIFIPVKLPKNLGYIS